MLLHFIRFKLKSENAEDITQKTKKSTSGTYLKNDLYSNFSARECFKDQFWSKPF